MDGYGYTTIENIDSIRVIFDRQDGSISLCEIKYSEKQFAIDKSYYQELMRKIGVFKKQTRTKKQLFLCMITTYGLKQTIYSEELVSGQITLEDLFKEG